MRVPVIKKIIFLILNFQILVSLCFAQRDYPGWLSYKRLALSLYTTYHFSPWDNYNNAVATVTNQIRLDNFFDEPTGFYDKINGDVTASGSLGYNLTKNVSILFTGQLGRIDSRFETYPDSTKLPTNVRSAAHHQKMTFDLHAFGFGVKRDFQISKRFSFYSTFGIDRYTGQLKINWRHNRNTRGALSKNEGIIVNSQFRKSDWGWNTGGGLSWRIERRISILMSLNFRKVKFTKLKGDGSYTVGPEFYEDATYNFKAELVQAENYFGIKTEDFYSFLLPSLTFLTEPNKEARVPATIDLNSFGIRAGIQYSF